MKINPFLMKRGKRKSLFDNYKSLAAITLFIFISLSVNAQVWQRVHNNGVVYDGIGSSRFMPIPTGCGSPSFSGHSSDSTLKQSAVYFDTCANTLYNYNPSSGLWDSVSNSSTIAGMYVVNVTKNATADSFYVWYGDGTYEARPDSIGASAFKQFVYNFFRPLTVTSNGVDTFDIKTDTGRSVSQLVTGGTLKKVIDSLGGGGSSQGLNDVLVVNPQTRLNILWYDTLAATSGINTWILEPKNYDTAYASHGKQMAWNSGYGIYRGVNASGRPNDVLLMNGYNGGYGAPIDATEASWGMRAETWFETGGQNLSEFHLPEFKPISGALRRPFSMYINNNDGGTSTVMQIEQLSILRGATDSAMLGVDKNNMTYQPSGDGSFAITSTRTPANTFNQSISSSGIQFNTSATTPSIAFFQFNSPSIFKTNATIGTTYGSSVVGITRAANENSYYATTTATGSNVVGYFGDFNTSGILTGIGIQNTGVGRTRNYLYSIGGGKASYELLDASGNNWSQNFTGSSYKKALKFSYNQGGALDSVFQIYNTGQLAASEYGSGTFTGTPTYNLSVDASGNVIETSASGGGWADTLSTTALTSGVKDVYVPKNLSVTGTINGVKKYVALLSQSGTSAPTATVLENSLGGTLVWSYDAIGQYHATLTGVFTANKRIIIGGPLQYISDLNADDTWMNMSFPDADTFQLYLQHTDGSNSANNILTNDNCMITILVYP